MIYIFLIFIAAETTVTLKLSITHSQKQVPSVAEAVEVILLFLVTLICADPVSTFLVRQDRQRAKNKKD